MLIYTILVTTKEMREENGQLEKKSVAGTILTLIIASTLCVAFNAASALAEEAPEDYPLLGLLDAVGTYFEVNNSAYLNISITSTETVHMVLESVPRIIILLIESNNSATSTVLDFSNFEPEKAYYRYQDGNLTESFTTDSAGNYSYVQDIHSPHHIFIVENTATIYIRPDGSVDPSTAPIQRDGDIYSFSDNIHDTITVQRDNIVIDGNGFTLQGGLFGFYLISRSGVTIKNVIIKGWLNGILLVWSPNNKFSENTVSNNRIGICVSYDSDECTISENTVTSNDLYGIFLRDSRKCIITRNSVTNMNYGVFLDLSDQTTVVGNTVSGNSYGVFIGRSDHTTIFRNAFLSNYYGMYLHWDCHYNIIYHNNFVDNTIQAYDKGLPSNPTNNWDHPDMLEGNYWSDYPGIDDGSGTGKHAIAGDGIGDTYIPWPGPYYDFYPFTCENGWIVTAEVDIDPDTLNLKSNGEFINVYIELPEGHDVADIVLETVYLEGIQAITDPTYGFVTDPDAYLMDHDGDGIQERMVKFDRASVLEWIGSADYGEDTGKSVEVTLTITGEVDGAEPSPFEGSDTVKVLLKG